MSKVNDSSQYGGKVLPNADIQVIRSKRKTLSMTLKPEGLVVRVPLRASEKQIREFIDSHQEWIRRAVARQERQRLESSDVPPLTDEDIQRLSKKARDYIPDRVAYFAPQVGVTYGRITIRHQKSRWGSCSPNGNLSFNCLLMLTPAEVIDSVVVHELCHRKEMNHSDKFYREVLRVFPDYRSQRKWLKDHGGAIMQRMR